MEEYSICKEVCRDVLMPEAEQRAFYRETALIALT